jgi:hypothetical protein
MQKSTFNITNWSTIMEVVIHVQVIPTPSNPNLTLQAFYVATKNTTKQQT